MILFPKKIIRIVLTTHQNPDTLILMRMWMCDTDIHCVRHLNGEYNELLMFKGSVHKKKRIDKYIINNCLEPLSAFQRFSAIWMEKIKRGHSPQHTPDEFKDIDLSYLPEYQRTYRIDRQAALEELLRRCPRCYARFYGLPEPKLKNIRSIHV